MKFGLKIFLVKPRTKTQYYNVLVMFVVGFLNEDRIVVDMLEVHDLLVEDFKLAKISQIPQLYERSRMCLGQDLYKVCYYMLIFGVMVRWDGQV